MGRNSINAVVFRQCCKEDLLVEQTPRTASHNYLATLNVDQPVTLECQFPGIGIVAISGRLYRRFLPKDVQVIIEVEGHLWVIGTSFL